MHVPIQSRCSLPPSQKLVVTCENNNQQEKFTMLKWALIFFIVALVAALFGFGGIAGTAAGIAKILFIGFLIVAAIALIMGLAGGRRSI